MSFLQHRWVIYIHERFSLLPFGALSGGIALSGLALKGHSVSLTEFLVCSLGILCLLFQQRLMDDVNSKDKDQIAHPAWPLPRKAIAANEAVQVVHGCRTALLIYCLVVWASTSATAALVYAAAEGYLWVQYRGFLTGRWLLQRPFLGGLLRHLVLFPVVFFCAAANNPDGFLGGPSWAFASMLTGASFCYDICGKFNPHLHPILGTYVHFYGFRRSFEVAAMSLVVAALGATALGLESLLFPCEIFVLAAMATLFVQPGWFRLPEVASSISLMAHAWAPAISLFFYA